jgi:FtsP/CotA-like multicopper oxidase with cupredoxin domain
MFTRLTHITRRQVLSFGALGGALLVLNACLPRREGATGPAQAAAPTPPVAAPSAAQGDGTPDIELTLRAAPARVPLRPGRDTVVWRYEATLHRGPPEALETLPDTYVGPILRVRRGQRLRITFINDLPEREQESVIHWHGLHVPPEQDGQPQHAVAPGQRRVYDFTVTDRAGTYWFHPHPHGLTGEQVYRGMAGLLIVSDDEEAALGLPTGAQDVPLVLQDRTLDGRNQLVYLNADSRGGHMGHGGMGDMMARMMGFLGQEVLVNGRPDATLEAVTGAYRLRLLNGSNARIFKLAWSDGTPLEVIGTDGGLLPRPLQRPFVMLAPGERVELWADWRSRRVGEELALMSQSFEGAEFHAMGGMAGATEAPPLGAAMSLLRVRFVRQEADAAAGTVALPETLTPLAHLRAADAVNADHPRRFVITARGMQFLFNGRTYEMGAVAEDEIVRLGDTEVWEFVNARNPGNMMEPEGMAHPIHIHGVQFSVLGREVVPELRGGWETVRQGYVDEGWKDTVLMMPGETLRLALRFEDYAGDYLYHCHNLEHEDSGMMRHYRVAPGGAA